MYTVNVTLISNDGTCGAVVSQQTHQHKKEEVDENIPLFVEELNAKEKENEIECNELMYDLLDTAGHSIDEYDIDPKGRY